MVAFCSLWLMYSGSPKYSVAKTQKACCSNMLLVRGFHQPSPCMWISMFLFPDRFQILNSRICSRSSQTQAHNNACKSTHAHTHTIIPHYMPSSPGRCHGEVWAAVWLNWCGENSILFTNSHQLPAVGRDSDDCVCAERKCEQEGGWPSLPVSVGELKSRKWGRMIQG